ncbi:hypothetical protein FJ934_25725 [Mesorhizobium sp. B2-4-12]|uniref:hypothetical protein n=1 Tax=Mesorhizobium sp. B2-4-12 TaxID=2589937 RepID=UPI00112690CC|nr:hypothetical protein [Mesorhizobium sp. B2-4-12]TPK88879.1 hypothetical protein FJ934_25725 [Mesorhizobium sp. B2-4-12]
MRGRPPRHQFTHRAPLPHLDAELGARRAELGIAAPHLAAREALDGGLQVAQVGVAYRAEIAAHLHLDISQGGLREA